MRFSPEGHVSDTFVGPNDATSNQGCMMGTPIFVGLGGMSMHG